jgi:hypothetical protein
MKSECLFSPKAKLKTTAWEYELGARRTRAGCLLHALNSCSIFGEPQHFANRRD